MGAREVAKRLAYEFMKAGQYNTGLGTAVPVGLTPAADGMSEGAFQDAFAPFSGLAVQAVGYEKGGIEEKVHIYLTKGSKKAEAAIQTSSGEVKIVVDRMGILSVRPEHAGKASNRGNLYLRGPRIACGSSCAPSGEGYSGTMGALVKKNGHDTLYVLSNNHVLAACNHIPAEMPVMSPSNIDVQPGGRSAVEICRHAEIVELRSGIPPLVEPCCADAALGKVHNNGIVSSWQGDPANGYDTPTEIVEPTAELRVKKFGRTTGLTIGQVESVIPDAMMVSYKSKHFQASVWFQDIWNVVTVGSSPFALAGDSGSLVVTEDGRYAVGLLFAASPSGNYGWMISMDRILECFDGITLIAGHGV